MDMLTDLTPGNAPNRAWSSSYSARIRSRENAGPVDTFTTSTWSCRKPASTERSFCKVRMNRPAAVSRTTSSATCTAIIARPQMFRVRSAPVALSFNPGWTARLAPSAGNTPHNTAVTIVTAAANANMRAFGATSSTIGLRPRDIMTRSRLVAQYASASPAAPPAAARSAVSVRSCRTIRPRAAPSDSLTAISCCLALERTINRPARLAHAASRTTPTAAIRI
jgi:hypothetical protein